MTFKQRINKILAVMCVAFLLVPYGAKAEQVTNSPDCTYERSVLSALGIINVGNNFNPSESVTRAQMAHYLVRFLNISGMNSTSIEKIYSDVNENTDYVSDIYIMTQLGVLKGFKDGSFHPNDPIVFHDAVKVIMTMLGYTLPAERAGGYVAGYLKYAYEIDLFDNLEVYPSDRILSSSELIILLYNMLDAEFISDSFGVGNTVSKEGETVLTDMLKIQKGKGVVTANSLTGLTTAEGTEKGKVIIENTLFDCGQTNINDYLGCNVEFYYKTDYDIDENVILYAKLATNNKILEINSDDIIGYNDNTISYYSEKNKQEKARISVITDLIYNNKPSQSIANEDICIKNGTLRLIDNNSDGIYEVVIAKDYRTICVQAIDYVKGRIFDKYDPAKSLHIELNDIDKSVFIYDREGNPTTLNAIEKDALLCCLISRNNDIVEIYEVVNEIIGVIEEKSVEDDSLFITVNGKTYKVAEVLRNYGTEFEIGTNSIFYLDIQGQIAQVIEGNNTKYSWAYLKAKGFTRGLNKQLILQLFDQGSLPNALNELNCVKALKINGIKYKDVSEQDSLIADSVGGVIRYCKNADGEITDIRTIDGDKFEKIFEGNGYLDRGTDTFDSKFAITGTTGVFMLPSEGKETGYSYGTVDSLLKHDTVYNNMKAYRLTDGSLFCDMLIIVDDDTAQYTRYSPVIFVEKVIMALNEDGNMEKQIRGFKDGKQISIFAEDDSILNNLSAFGDVSGETYAAKRGDLLLCNLSTDGKIKSAQLLYRASEHKIFSETNPSSESANAANRILKGYIYQREGSTIVLTSVAKDMLATINEESKIYSKVGSTCPIYVYDSESKESYIGTINDVFDFKSADMECSDVAFYTGSGVPYALIVIR